MKRKYIYVAIMLLLAVVFIWVKCSSNNNSKPEPPKQEALHAGIHSAVFNQKVDVMIANYLRMKDAFVDADTLHAKDACKQMIAVLDSFPLEELKKDTSGIFAAADMQINDIKVNAQSLLTQSDITEMRQDFRMVSENLYPFLKTIHYEGKVLYWQNCPMAFGEDKEGNWLSNSAEILNPYQGRNHPVNNDKMLHCGEIKDSIK